MSERFPVAIPRRGPTGGLYSGYTVDFGRQRQMSDRCPEYSYDDADCDTHLLSHGRIDLLTLDGTGYRVSLNVERQELIEVDRIPCPGIERHPCDPGEECHFKLSRHPSCARLYLRHEPHWSDWSLQTTAIGFRDQGADWIYAMVPRMADLVHDMIDAKRRHHAKWLAEQDLAKGVTVGG